METQDRRSSLFDPELLRRVVRQLEHTDIDELEVRQGDARLFLRRVPLKRVGIAAAPVETEQAGVAVVAPLTGVFYTRASPEQLPYVEAGTIVELGQVVALIETMKLFNEVTADVAGEVLTVVVHDGDLVETGQPLMYLRPAMEER